MLRRLLLIPAVALILMGFASVSQAQLGPYVTWCYGVPIPPGYKIVGHISSILCSPYHPGVNNAYMLLPN